MPIKEILNLVIRGSKVFAFPLQYDQYGTSIVDNDGQMVMQIRGWGRIQYHEGGKGAEIQDTFAQWVVDTLNAAHDAL